MIEKDDLITIHYPCGCEYDFLRWTRLVIDEEEYARLCPEHLKEYDSRRK